MTGERNSSTLQLNVSWKIVSAILLVIIISMLAFWMPWQGTTSDDRTITVSGEATLQAEPDELTFSPYFEAASTDELTTKAGEVTAKLKELGVEDKNIKTNASNYDKYYIMPTPDGGGSSLTLQFTITITNNKELSQKVQDYLVTQNPKGQVTPQAGFSDEKRKSLEDEASTKATTDAKAKAEKMAKELGGKLGKVKAVTPNTGFGVYPVSAEAARDTTSASNQGSLPIQAGENEFTYQVTVEFFLK